RPRRRSRGRTRRRACARGAREERDDRQQSALRRAARAIDEPGGALSATRRHVEAPLCRVDRVHPERRSAVAEADRPQGEPPDAALQRRAGMPFLRVPRDRWVSADAKISARKSIRIGYNTMMLPSRLYESEHTKFMRELLRQ